MNGELKRYQELFGQAEEMRALGAAIARVASSAEPILIRGEAGVGKEVVAEALHSLSGQPQSPLIKIACASFPAERLQADLFEAHEGRTLLLKDIDRMPLDTQARLATALRDRQYRARLVATTSADLPGLVAAGQFSAALFDILTVNALEVPPLRKHRESILPLADRFLRAFSREFQRPVPRLSATTSRLLATYDWPGNIRELEHMVKRCVVLGGEPHLRGELESRLAAGRRARAGANGTPTGLRDIARHAAREAERAALEAALQRSGGNRAAAARDLKVSYKTLLHKLTETGLAVGRSRRIRKV